jgi:PAS domain S-box-containing protein
VESESGSNGGNNSRQYLDISDLCRPLAEASPAPIAAVEGESNTIRYVNPAFCLLAGRPEEDLVGVPFSGVFEAEDEFLSLFARVYRTGQSETYAAQNQPATSKFHSCVLWPLMVQPDGAIGIIVQVIGSTLTHEQSVAINQALMLSALRQHELVEEMASMNTHLQTEIAQHKQSEGRVRALLESASEAIVVVDEKGEILLVNGMTERFFGYERGELFGRPVEILLREDLHEAHRGHRQTYFAHPHNRAMGVGMPLSGRRKDGTTFPVEVSLSFIDEGGAKVVLAMVNDVTERKRVEGQLRELAKVESLGVLAGGIAHDFNNMLTGILGNASMAMDELPAGSAGQAMIGDVIRSAERAAHLTNQMLAYSGKGRFLVQPVNLSKFTRDIVHLVRSSIPRTAELDLQLMEDVPLVAADIAQLQQLIMNLLINAGEAIGNVPGTVTVRTGVRELAEGNNPAGPPYAAVVPGRYVFLQVRDTGSGMDELTRQRIFDPFFTTKFTGRGLGLSAVLGIVRGHQGTIDVESTPGHGATFTVLFPETTLHIRPEPTPQRALRVGSGTILVVDDEEAILKMTRFMLESEGYQVLVAKNGAVALDIFRKDAGQIVAVLLDMTMPVMSGAETLKHLRGIRPDVPIALSSGFSELEALAHFPVKTVEAFVQKPYKAADLVGKINQIVAESIKTRLATG